MSREKNDPLSKEYRRIGLIRVPGEGKVPNSIEEDENGVFCTDEKRKMYCVPPKSNHKGEMAQAVRLLVEAKKILVRGHINDTSIGL